MSKKGICILLAMTIAIGLILKWINLNNDKDGEFFGDLDAANSFLQEEVTLPEYISLYNPDDVDEVKIYLNAGTTHGMIFNLNSDTDKDMINQLWNDCFADKTFTIEKNGYDTRQYSYYLQFHNQSKNEDFIVFIQDDDAIMFEGVAYEAKPGGFGGKEIDVLLKDYRD